jgi:hypothetical protein
MVKQEIVWGEVLYTKSQCYMSNLTVLVEIKCGIRTSRFTAKAKQKLSAHSVACGKEKEFREEIE